MEQHGEQNDGRSRVADCHLKEPAEAGGRAKQT